MAIEIEESRRQVISFNDNLFEIWDDITTFDVVSWMRAVRARMEPQSIHWHFSGGSPCPDNVGRNQDGTQKDSWLGKRSYLVVPVH